MSDMQSRIFYSWFYKGASVHIICQSPALSINHRNLKKLEYNFAIEGDSGEIMNFFHVKGLLISWRFLLVVWKNYVRDFLMKFQ